MKAAVFEREGVLTLKEVDKPKILKADDIIGKIEVCSICGTDNTKSYCRHWAGRSYEKEGGAEVCTYTLTGARDAYEFSLVAVPAQRAAGVKKSYMGTPVYETEPEEKQNSEECSVKELFLQAKITELLTKIHKED